MSFVVTTRARIYLRDSATFEGRPAYELIVQAFREAGIDDVSVHHGIMGFDPASGMLSARPLRFHPDLPVVVEAVGRREDIERALPWVRQVLNRGLITLAEVELYVPEWQFLHSRIAWKEDFSEDQQNYLFSILCQRAGLCRSRKWWA